MVKRIQHGESMMTKIYLLMIYFLCVIVVEENLQKQRLFL